MINKKFNVGFIGVGNMGGAIASAICKVISPEKVAICCKTNKHAEEIKKQLKCNISTIEELSLNSKFVFLGIKPQVLNEVAKDIKLNNGSVVVSMLAGVSIEKLRSLLGKDTKIIRIMPNTPCAIGYGMTLFTVSENVTDEEKTEFLSLMKKTGSLDEIPEKLIDAGGCITGCGPAFAYMFIEALADGGVASGMPRDKAITYASQMLLGSSKMVLELKKHPEQLKDEVCSPGGSTIKGVEALENAKFRSACISAITSAYEKTKSLGK